MKLSSSDRRTHLSTSHHFEKSLYFIQGPRKWQEDGKLSKYSYAFPGDKSTFSQHFPENPMYFLEFLLFLTI